VKTAWLVPIAMLVALIGLGCEDEFMTQDSGIATNEAGQTMKVTATPDNLDISAGGAVSILIELYAEDGSGIQNAAVTLTASNGVLGAASLTTDIDGTAVTTLTASTRPGYAIVVATYESMQVMVKVDFYEGDPSA
jgi:hypothetical protein